jgi:hypothetical protein
MKSSIAQKPASAISRDLGIAASLINAQLEPEYLSDSHCRPGVIHRLVNDSRFIQTNFDEPLTTYSVGYRDPNNIEATLEFFAPATTVNRRFTYKTQTNAEEFYSDSDDQRAIGGAFKEVKYSGTEVEAKTINRGLMMVVDLDEATPGWEQRTVAKLTRRLMRNSLRRAVTLLSAAATNTAKTWDATAGKDPDQDVITEQVTASTASGVAFNRVGYGHTAWAKRGLSHRAQDTAGGFASASLTPEQLAGVLQVDQVLVSRERYQTGAATKAEIVSNLVLMFHAMGGADLEDASNIKRFVSPTSQGGMRAVYIWQIGPKQMGVAVEQYELSAITATLGIRKFTVS